MKVFISASVNIFEVEVEPTDTIDQLRVKFIEKYGHSFRTRFKGRIISEGKILLMPTIVTLNLSKGEIERERKILANYGVKEGTKMYFLPFLLSGGSDICYVRLAGPARPEGEEKRKYGYYRVLMPNLTLEEFKLRILEEEIQYFNEEGKSLLGIMSREENQEIQSLKNESNTIIERIRSNTNLNKDSLLFRWAFHFVFVALAFLICSKAFNGAPRSQPTSMSQTRTNLNKVKLTGCLRPVIVALTIIILSKTFDGTL